MVDNDNVTSTQDVIVTPVGDANQVQDPPKAEGNPPQMVPYERVSELTARNKELTDRLQALEAQQAKGKEDDLKAQQKWQELAEKREKELSDLKTQSLRQQVAMEKRLPPELVGRLQGDDYDSLVADADQLLTLVKPSGGPGVPPAPARQQPATVDISNMSAKEIRDLPPDQKQRALQGRA